jgi:hypothetical protein
MKKILVLSALALSLQVPAEASVAGKVKAVALFPVRIVKNVAIGAVTGVLFTVLESAFDWQG